MAEARAQAAVVHQRVGVVVLALFLIVRNREKDGRSLLPWNLRFDTVTAMKARPLNAAAIMGRPVATLRLVLKTIGLWW